MPDGFFRAALLAATAGAGRVAEMAGAYDALVVDVSDSADAAAAQGVIDAAQSVGLPAWAWVEVARDEPAARAHPEWGHEPQHHEWLEVFPDWPGGPAVVFPWICVNNKAAFAYSLSRVRRLVSPLRGLAGLFLNDIQGAPAGCGCGNILCRSWDNSPGEKVAPSPYESPDIYFPHEFLKAVQSTLPGLPVTAVLCEECETFVDVGGVYDPDGTIGACHGVPCRPCSLEYYPGLIRRFSEEPQVGLLSFYRLFDRDRPLYGARRASWISAILRRYQASDPHQRVLSVVQGWDASPEDLAEQEARAREGGAAGVIVALSPVDQSFWPVKRDEV